SPAWNVRAVVVNGGSESEVAIPIEGSAGSAVVTGSGDADAVYLVVSAISSSRSDRTSAFGWSYEVTSAPIGEVVVDTGEPEDTGLDGSEKTSGGSCAAAGGAPGVMLALMGLTGLRRRMR
ncbi:MAG: hypothetical protein ACI8S6_003465, partial [Myxococcota bacterium]